MSRLNDSIRLWQGIVALVIAVATPLVAVAMWRGNVDAAIRYSVETQHNISESVEKSQKRQDDQIEKLTGNVLSLHDSVTRLQVSLEGLNTRLIIDAKATHDIGETQMKVVQILDMLTNTKGKP